MSNSPVSNSPYPLFPSRFFIPYSINYNGYVVMGCLKFEGKNVRGKIMYTQVLCIKRLQRGKIKWEIVILENRKKFKIIGAYIY